MPGSGLGYCRKHYRRVYKYGDPQFVVERTRRQCSVGGCEGHCVGGGLCSKHYTRMKRHGTTDHPGNWANASEGTKWCPQCRDYRPDIEFGSDSNKRDGLASCCKSCAASRARERRERDPSIYLRPKRVAVCAECGDEFQADERRTLHCSIECQRVGKRRADRAYQLTYPDRHAEANRRWREQHPDRNRKKATEYRARKANALVERFAEQEIYIRDGWTCQICSNPIDLSLRAPHPFSPSIDHRVPLSRGGEHSRANCQASHLVCNLRKGDKVTP